MLLNRTGNLFVLPLILLAPLKWRKASEESLVHISCQVGQFTRHQRKFLPSRASPCRSGGDPDDNMSGVTP
ncbi:hypothetical protein F5J12DRAFT_850673 [Pisolithus orientalis]|uniref:uncharacterized protein n=1 Tax=Pisolithus orientalis TaxID=936130 RepID=UPI00222425E9|nr:uncharacterized protein F5J12DRAFT_850673 [Pisolithus orientalis]KAI5997840.1 hypothetical protein F5J12DRAFT_850673 [Pisolithus orientalis]